MNIGQASRAAGVSAKMIRHYEAIGLLRPATRSANDYRQYAEHDVHELVYIRRARQHGFSMEEIRSLLSLWRDQSRSSAEVKKIASTHLAALDRRLHDMREMADELRRLVDACQGGERPDCPILSNFAEAADAASSLPRVNGHRFV